MGKRGNSSGHFRTRTEALARLSLAALLLSACAHQAPLPSLDRVCSDGKGWGSLEEGIARRDFRYQFLVDKKRRHFKFAVDVPFQGEELVEVDFAPVARGGRAQMAGDDTILPPVWSASLGQLLHLIYTPGACPSQEGSCRGWRISLGRGNLRLVGPADHRGRQLIVRYSRLRGFFRRQVLMFKERGKSVFTVRLFVKSCQAPVLVGNGNDS